MTKDQLVQFFSEQKTRISIDREAEVHFKRNILAYNTLVVEALETAILKLNEALGEIAPGWVLVFRQDEHDTTDSTVYLEYTGSPGRPTIYVGALRISENCPPSFRDIETKVSFIKPTYKSLKVIVFDGITAEECLLSALKKVLHEVF